MKSLKLWPWFLHLLISASVAAGSQQTVLMNQTVTFAPEWNILGPFKLGTREVVWQSDPLAALGGFPNIHYDEKEVFPSPLKANALVSWKTCLFQTTTTASSTTVDVVVSHREIDWDYTRSIYGWAAIQFQSWIRGTLYNHAGQDIKVAIHAPGIIDLVLDSADGTTNHFGVDLYGIQRAPIVAKLKPGANIVNIRLIRDVRANGGQMPPLIEAFVHVTALNGEASILENSLMVPDVYHGRFVAPFASLTVVNHGAAAITVENVIINAPEKGGQTTKQQLRILPGQSRPLQFQVDNIHHTGPNLVATVSYRQGSKVEEVHFPFQVTNRTPEEPQKITFLHPSGAVSYAVLLPPSRKVAEQHKGPLPILVALHGSGLDVDSYQIKHSFDGAPDLPAWLLFPTGMSPWCGDDWHTWGMADIDAALEAIPTWLQANNWKGPGVLTDRFLIAGHSNGGHGTWNYVLKRPDRIIAAAPASGYISVENYVPQSMWDDELFRENMRGKPVLVQHGELDDNVPAYHSRLMKSYSALQRGIDLEYAEIPTKFHWWDGAMTTKPMLQFYLEHLAPPIPHTQPPNEFSFVVADTYEFGSLHGIQIDQLLKPDALARVSVDTKNSNNTKSWKIRTRNVRRIRLDRRNLWDGLHAIHFDGTPTNFVISDISDSGCFVYDGEDWKVESSCGSQHLSERTGKQRGSMDAILRTSGPFQIVRHSAEGAEDTTLQVSRNLLQYFGADSVILDQVDYTAAIKAGGNVISISLAGSAPRSLLDGFPITVEDGAVCVRGRGQKGPGQKMHNASGAAWIQPLDDERLELVIWGESEATLRQAARLVPTVTGGGQPDFVILEIDDLTGVHGKVASMGFFDFAWNISAASYVP